MARLWTNPRRLLANAQIRKVLETVATRYLVAFLNLVLLFVNAKVLGAEGLGAAVEHGFTLARWAEDEARKNPDIEIISPAQMAMVNFRYAPAGLTEQQLDELNREISRRIVASGYAGVFTTVLSGKTVLRICAIHPEAKEADMRGTVQRLNALCTEILAG